MKRTIWLAAIVAAAAAGLLYALTIHPKNRVLTFDGLAPVRMGMTVAEAEDALGAKLQPLDTSDGASSESCWYTRRTDGVDQAIPYMIRDGRVARIDVDNGPPQSMERIDPGVTTERGIRIGSSEEDVKKAYGPSLDITPHAYGDENDHYLTVLTADKSRGIRFVTWEGKVDTFHVGTADAILLVEGCS